MTDQELSEGILSGNEDCFKELVDRYQTQVLNICYKFLQNKNDAEDVVQDIFVEVFLSLYKFKKSAKFSTWLYRISVNKSLNFIRDNKKRKLIKRIENGFEEDQYSEFNTDENNVHSIENKEIQEEREKLLHESIKALPNNQQTAFTLSKLENFSYMQISDIMNVSISSVEGLIHRAKKNVKKKILNRYKKKTDAGQKFFS